MDVQWSITLTALAVLGYGPLLFTRSNQRYLNRFRNSSKAGQLYVFSWGAWAVAYPLALTDALNNRGADLALVLLPLVPMAIAEVVRSRVDRRAKAGANQVHQTSEVTQ
jgi:hypothetical protein